MFSYNQSSFVTIQIGKKDNPEQEEL